MEDPELPFATGDRVIAPRVDRSSSPFLMLTDEPRPPDFQDGVGCEYGRPMTVLGFASGEDGATHVSVTAAPDTVSVKRRGAGSNAV
jgi:hypothetical protein